MADRAENLRKLQNEQKRYQTLLDMQEKSGKDYTASLEKQQQKIKGLADELKKVNSANQSFVADLEKGVSSIASQFGSFKDLQTQVVNESKSIANLNDVQKEAISSILEETRNLSSLNAEDVEQIAAKNEALNKQLEIAAAILGKDSEIFKILQKVKGEANDIANLTKEEKDVIDLQQQAADKLNQGFQAISETIQTTIMKLASVKGVMGGIIFAAGDFAGKLADVNKELGQVGEGFSKQTGEAAVLSYFLGDSAVSLKTLSAEMGGLNNIAEGVQTQTSLISNNMGISSNEAAVLTGTLARLNGGSAETAGNLAAGARDFAVMNGIPVSQLMGDVAGATEEFALFGKQGGQNIIQAAGYAAKLGTNMSTLSKITDGLLDFESSITKELELSAMLGKNINLNKARGLAYDGDIEGATKETLKQLGGINAFNKMDYFQKKQTAALLGVSVAEMQKMVTNEEQAAKISKARIGDFNSMVEAGKALTAQFGPKALKGIGTFLMLSSQANQSFSLMGKTKIGKKIGDRLGFGTAQKQSVDGGDKMSGGGKKSGGGLKSLASGLKAMGNAKVLFGALNLIPTAIGMVAMIAAIPGLIALGLGGVPAGVGLRALGQGLSAFGKTVSKALPAIGIGLLVLAGFGASMIPLAYALGVAAPAISAFGDVISSAFNGIASIVSAVGGVLIGMLDVITLEKAVAMSTLGLSFIGLAAGITALSAVALLGGGIVRRFLTKTGESLGNISSEGIANVTNLADALRGMAGGLTAVVTQLDRLDTEKLEALSSVSISASIGGAIGSIGSSISGLIDGIGGGESLSEYETTMLDRMTELKDAFMTNKDVYLDREKVTGLIMASADRTIKNRTNINNS
jgi:hypothetical protein